MSARGFAISVATTVAALDAAIKANIRAGDRAALRAVSEAGKEIQTGWRGQVASSLVGRRLPNTVRNNLYPNAGGTMRAATLVFSKAPQILHGHEHGATIVARNTRFLAIPTPAAGKGAGGRRISPAAWERRTGQKLRMIWLGTRALLVLDRAVLRGRAGIARLDTTKRQAKAATVVIFVLVPQVKLPKRLDLARDAARAVDGLTGLIVANWMGEKIGR